MNINLSLTTCSYYLFSDEVGSYKVNKSTLHSLIFSKPDQSYTVSVSQNVVDTLNGRITVLTKAEWISVLFLATLLQKDDLVSRANKNLSNKVIVADHSHTLSNLPIRSNLWKLHLVIPRNAYSFYWKGYIEQYQDCITHLDLSRIGGYPDYVDDYLNFIANRCANLETLVLTDAYFSKEAFKSIRSLPRLTTLSLTQQQLLGFIPEFGRMPSLRTLTYDNRYNKGITDLTKLTEVENLTVQDVSYTNISTLKKLKTLHLKTLPKNKLDLKEFPDLTSFSAVLGDSDIPEFNCSKIESLELTNPKKNFCDLSFLSKFSNIKHLKIKGWPSLKDVSILARTTQLTSLHIESSQVQFIPLPANLEHLILKWNKLTELPALNGLKKLKTITSIKNNITSHITLKDLPSLENFTFEDSQGEIDRVYVQNVNSLRSLNLPDVRVKKLTLIGLASLETVFIDAASLTEMNLSNLPNLAELKMLNFPNLDIDERYGSKNQDGETTYFYPKPGAQNEFLLILNRFMKLRQIHLASDYRSFIEIAKKPNGVEFLKLCKYFPDLLSVLPPEVKIDDELGAQLALPLNLRLSILSVSTPDYIKKTVDQVSASDRLSWGKRKVKYGNSESTIYDVMQSIKENYIDKNDQEMHPDVPRFINSLTNEEIISITLKSVNLLVAVTPFLKTHQISVAIPVIPNHSFTRMLQKLSLKTAAGYLAYATQDQKSDYLSHFSHPNSWDAEKRDYFIGHIRKSKEWAVYNIEFQAEAPADRTMLLKLKSHLLLNKPSDKLKNEIELKINPVLEKLDLAEKEVASVNNAVKIPPIPEDFFDSLFSMIMNDPYKDKWGHVLDKSSWDQLKSNPFTTNAKIEVTPDVELKAKIDTFFADPVNLKEFSPK